MQSQKTPAELVRETIAERKSGWSQDQHRCFDLLCASWQEVMAECFEEEARKHRAYLRQLDLFLEYMDGETKKGLLRYEEEFLKFVTEFPLLRAYTEKEFGLFYWQDHVGHAYFCIAARKMNQNRQTRIGNRFQNFIKWMNAKTKNRFVVSYDELADLGFEPEAQSMDSFFQPHIPVPEKSLSSLMSLFLRDVADYQHEAVTRAMLSILRRQELNPTPDDEAPAILFSNAALKAELVGGKYEMPDMMISRNREQVLRRFAAFLILTHNERNPNFRHNERNSVFLAQARNAGLGSFIKGRVCTDLKGLLAAAKGVLHSEPIRRRFIDWGDTCVLMDELKDYCWKHGIKITDTDKALPECVLARLDRFPLGGSEKGRAKVVVYRNGKIRNMKTDEVCYLGDLIAEDAA